MSTMQVTDANGDVQHILTTGDGSALDPFAIVHADNPAGTQRRLINRFLTASGDGTGNHNLNGDYSGAATTFKLAPGAGEVFRIARMIGYIQDTGSFDASAYGNGITLTNGISVQYDHAAGVTNLCDAQPVYTNGDWAQRCYDATPQNYGTGDEYLVFRWTFLAAGQYIRLDGDLSQEFRMVLNDDFTGLNFHRFMLQGYIE